MWLEIIRCLLAVSLLVATGTANAAEPPVRLSDDGAVILYRAQPGDLPGAIAERFGIPPGDVPSFLAANGITDPARLSAGHLFRITNPMAARATAAETRADTLASNTETARAEVHA